MNVLFDKKSLKKVKKVLREMANSFMTGFVTILSPGNVEYMLRNFSLREMEYFFTGIVR